MNRPRSVLLWLHALGLAQACNASKTAHSSQRGSQVATADATAPGGSPQVPGGQAAAPASPAASAAGGGNAQALIDQAGACAGQNKAWIPQLDSSKLGSSPAGDCGGPLVAWCCSLPVIQSLFTGSVDDLTAKMQPLLAGQLQIYACSQEAADQVKVHLIKYQANAISYGSVLLSGLLPPSATVRASDAACKKVDLASVLPQASTTPGASSPAPTAAGVSFSDTIDPILKASCDGGACHGAGASTGIVLIGHEANVKAQASGIVEQLNAGTMPTGGQSISAANKQTLLKYLQP